MKKKAVSYFKQVVNTSSSPHQVADTLMHDYSFHTEAKAAMKELAAVAGQFASFLDMAHYVIQWIGDISAEVQATTSPTQASAEPACPCDSKALASYGHEPGCAYMAWKQGRAVQDQ